MKRAMTITSAAVLLTTLALFASVGLAGTIFIPASGEDWLTVTDYGDMWTDGDGITHIRGMTVTTVTSGADIDGIPIDGVGTYEANFNINMATGDGDMVAWGPLVMNYGDLSGSWRIKFTSTLTGFVYDGEFNAARGYDDFAGWHFRGTWGGIYGQDTPNFFDAFFQIPGGDKAATTEVETWSAVKDLYR